MAGSIRKGISLAGALSFMALAQAMGGCAGDLPPPQARPVQRSFREDEPPRRRGPLSPDCDAMNAKLRWDYELVRRCERDTDCFYVEGFFTLIERDGFSHTLTKSVCGGVTPYLMAANGARLGAMLQTMLRDARLQAEACAPDPDPTEVEFPCDRVTRIVVSGQPRCLRGSCSVDSAVASPIASR